jgi:hypothetical protein
VSVAPSWNPPPFLISLSLSELPRPLSLTTVYRVAYASAGVVIADPIELLNRIGGPATTSIAILGLLLSTLTTNIAANVVGPANAVVNLSPKRVTFATGMPPMRPASIVVKAVSARVQIPRAKPYRRF